MRYVEPYGPACSSEFQKRELAKGCMGRWPHIFIIVFLTYLLSTDIALGRCRIGDMLSTSDQHWRKRSIQKQVTEPRRWPRPNGLKVVIVQTNLSCVFFFYGFSFFVWLLLFIYGH